MHTDLIAYLGVLALITVTPGADTLVVVRMTARHGRRAGIATGAGSASGLFLWGAASAVGVAAVLAASATAFAALKLVGAAYLVVLGLQCLRTAGAGAFGGSLDADRDDHAPAPSRARCYRVGLLTNLLNPKAAVFFTALLPQFLDRHDPALPVFALLTALASASSIGILTVWSFAVHRGARLLRRAPVRRALDRVTGCALIALGIRVAFERR